MNVKTNAAGRSTEDSSEHLSVTAQMIIALMSIFFSFCAVFGGLGWELYTSGTFSMGALKESIGLSLVVMWLAAVVILFFLLRLRDKQANWKYIAECCISFAYSSRGINRKSRLSKSLLREVALIPSMPRTVQHQNHT